MAYGPITFDRIICKTECARKIVETAEFKVRIRCWRSAPPWEFDALPFRFCTASRAVELDSKLIPVLQPFSNLIKCAFIQGIFSNSRRKNWNFRPTTWSWQTSLTTLTQPSSNIAGVGAKTATYGSHGSKRSRRTMCATPPDMSLLALSVQVYGHRGSWHNPGWSLLSRAKVIQHVKIKFIPIPLSLSPSPCFFSTHQGRLQQKQKTLRNSLSAIENLYNGSRVAACKSKDRLKTPG